MSNKKSNIEVVLPAGGAPQGSVAPPSGTATKDELKLQISNLKTQQKETARNIKAAQKELSKLSKPAAKKNNIKKSNGKK